MKQFIQHLDIPFTVLLLCMALGLFFLWADKKRPMTKAIFTVVFVLLLLISNRMVGSFLLGDMEYQYPALTEISPDINGARFVVVLGGQAQAYKEWPITSQVGMIMLIRLVEGVRLFHEIPGSTLVLSGGSRTDVSDAEMMKNLAVALGVPEARIQLETKSTSTYEEALFLKDTLKSDPFILVTSAKHMPRAVLLFEKQGMHPIPAPTGHITLPQRKIGLNDFIPRSSNIGLYTEFFYEYLGYMKAKLTGKI